MSIFNVLLMVLYGILMPFIVGQLWTRRFKEHVGTIAFPIICGVIMMFIIFEVLAVPMILLRKPFLLLYQTWFICMWIITAVSLVWNYKNIVNTFVLSLKRIKTITIKEGIVWSAVIFLILFQTWLLAGNMHTDTDDSRFVAEAMEAYEKDTMLQYHPLTGEFLGAPIGDMRKDVFAPFPLLYALFGRLLKVLPTVAAHVFMPILFIPLAYLVYFVIGRYFLRNNRLYVGIFLCLLSLIHLFSFESVYAIGYTLLAIIWHGRSVLATIVLPFAWYLLMQMLDIKNWKDAVWYYLLLLCTVIAACMTSSMSAILVPVLTMAYTAVYVVKQRKILPLFMMIPLWIPSMISLFFYKLLPKMIG